MTERHLLFRVDRVFEPVAVLASRTKAEAFVRALAKDDSESTFRVTPITLAEALDLLNGYLAMED
jgi:hypothetical protein